MLNGGLKKPNKPSQLNVSEIIMTLFMPFHQMGFRNFKRDYSFYVKN